MHLVTCCTRVRDLCQCVRVSSFSLLYSIRGDCCIGVRRPSDATQLHSSLHGVRGGIRGPSPKNDPVGKATIWRQAITHSRLRATRDPQRPSRGGEGKRFKRAWDSYALATGLNEKAEDVQVATLLTVIGEEAREVYSTFTGWENAGDSKKIAPVLEQFGRYCEPQKNTPFERYRFNRRCQEAGESYDQYRTALRKLAANCDFGAITPDELLRDRLVFGVRDSKIRERLLREPALTLKRTDEICRSAESTVSQLKLVEDGQGASISAVTTPPSHVQKHNCPNCGKQHDTRQRESCPALGKTCRKCGKRNHFALKCQSKRGNPGAHAVDESREQDSDEAGETLVLQLPVHCLDDSQFVTLRIKTGGFIRFQVDTGAQCNVLPLDTYKEATGDRALREVTPTNSRVTAYGGAWSHTAGCGKSSSAGMERKIKVPFGV